MNTHSIINKKKEVPIIMVFPLDAKNIDIHHIKYSKNGYSVFTAKNLKLKQLFLSGYTVSLKKGECNIRNGNVMLLDRHIILNHPFSIIFELSLRLIKKILHLTVHIRKLKEVFQIFFI